MSVIEPIDAPPDYWPANLISLEELKLFLQIEADDETEDRYFEVAIAAASSAIVRYTERDFGVPNVTEEREFQYEGGGILDIDDCTRVTRVTLVVPGATDLEVPSQAWTAQPPVRFEQAVHYYLVIPTVKGWPAISPQMGFTTNLDTYYNEGLIRRIPQIVKVTATWGWPDVPMDVKQAAAWTIDDWRTRVGDGESLTSHQIDTFSETWQRGPGSSPAQALPARVRDILAAYERIQV